jgi:hypothetical protein
VSYAINIPENRRRKLYVTRNDQNHYRNCSSFTWTCFWQGFLRTPGGRCRVETRLRCTCPLLADPFAIVESNRNLGERLLAFIHDWLSWGCPLTLEKRFVSRNMEAVGNLVCDHLDAWHWARFWYLAGRADPEDVKFRHSHRLGGKCCDTDRARNSKMALNQVESKDEA